MHEELLLLGKSSCMIYRTSEVPEELLLFYWTSEVPEEFLLSGEKAHV